MGEGVTGAWVPPGAVGDPVLYITLSKGKRKENLSYRTLNLTYLGIDITRPSNSSIRGHNWPISKMCPQIVEIVLRGFVAW